MTENKVEVDHQKGVVESGANEVVEIQENENRILETESGWVKQEPRKAAKKVRRQANKLQRDALVNGEESVGDSLVSVGDSLVSVGDSLKGGDEMRPEPPGNNHRGGDSDGQSTPQTSSSLDPSYPWGNHPQSQSLANTIANTIANTVTNTSLRSVIIDKDEVEEGNTPDLLRQLSLVLESVSPDGDGYSPEV